MRRRQLARSLPNSATALPQLRYRPTHRPSALRTRGLSPTHTDPASLCLFLFCTREIEILTTVNHPNVISLKDVFEDDKTVYLVLELVEVRSQLIRPRSQLKHSEFLLNRTGFLLNRTNDQLKCT
eukprot:825899-Rhodomonas_salina.1